MRATTIVLGGILVLATAALGAATLAPSTPQTAPVKSAHFQTEEVRSSGLVRTGLLLVPYDAVAGTLIIHPKGWEDVTSGSKADNPNAEASMFFVA